MSYKRDHIIGRQSIEIQFDSLDDAFGLQDCIAELYYEKLQPRINILFDELFASDTPVCIERVEVDCEIIDADNWEEKWVEMTLRKLSDQLRQADKNQRPYNNGGYELIFYLEHGYLPWNTRVGSLAELESGLVIDAGIIHDLMHLIGRNPWVAERLARNFRQHFVSKLIDGVFKENGISNYSFSRLLSEWEVDEESYYDMAELVLETIAQAPAGVEEIKTKAKKQLSRPLPEKDRTRPSKTRKKPVDHAADEFIYINNAGLVIFHPFLSKLFEDLELRNGAGWVGEPSVLQAIVAVQSLAVSQERIEEVDLVLPKILCGLPVEAAITEGLVASELIRSASDDLIQAVIGHWAALKNTGVASFREAFIQRKGKVTKVDHGWQLQVERKPIDVLFDRLPWGIGVIRLPWMKEMLFTEWA